jgi:antitoxin CptB
MRKIEEIGVTTNKRRARLYYQSWHRGTREMDLLLGSFADAHLNAFTPEQLDRYEALLEQSDPDLYDWITGKQAPPPEMTHDVMQLLASHSYAKKAV